MWKIDDKEIFRSFKGNWAPAAQLSSHFSPLFLLPLPDGTPRTWAIQFS